MNVWNIILFIPCLIQHQLQLSFCVNKPEPPLLPQFTYLLYNVVYKHYKMLKDLPIFVLIHRSKCVLCSMSKIMRIFNLSYFLLRSAYVLFPTKFSLHHPSPPMLIPCCPPLHHVWVIPGEFWWQKRLLSNYLNLCGAIHMCVLGVPWGI